MQMAIFGDFFASCVSASVWKYGIDIQSRPLRLGEEKKKKKEEERRNHRMKI